MVDDLTERLVCPSCRHPLIWRDDGSDCSECLQAYPVVDGIPLLVADLDQAKLMQAHYFDAEADADYETTRPHGTPALYSALLTDKFRRATRTLAAGLDGATVVVACGGSAMDAEYLARAGARVISTDISPGAAERARERARRFGEPFLSVVADAESLPFSDGGIELGYVHDGLDHLERPLSGLRELARVARRGLSITEPAEAAVTRAAMRIGLAQEIEEAGNRVERLRLADLRSALEECAFAVVSEGRYFMYYRHRPGRLEEMLSRRGMLRLVHRGLGLVNAVGSRYGNKLFIEAMRTRES